MSSTNSITIYEANKAKCTTLKQMLTKNAQIFKLTNTIQCLVGKIYPYQILIESEKLIFPYINKSRIRKSHVYVALIKNNEIISLCLIDKQDRRPFEIVSFVIAEQFRRKGYGHHLMQAVKQASSNFGVSSLGVIYKTLWTSNKAWESILNKTGWDKGVSDLNYIVLEDIDRLSQSPLISGGIITNSKYQVSPLTPEIEAYLKRQVVNEQLKTVIPIEAHPFQLKKPIYRRSSFIIKEDERLVGWMIVNELTDKVIQVTALYIRPEYRNQNLAVGLVAEAINRSERDKTAHFMIRAENQHMLDFFQKYLKDYMTIYQRRIRSLHIEHTSIN